MTSAVSVFIAKDFLWSKMWGFNIQFKHSTPRSAVPCRTHFSNVVNPSFCGKTCKAIKNGLAQTQSTDHGQLDLLGNRELHDCDGPLHVGLADESHTSAHLAEELRNTVTQWKPERPNMTIPISIVFLFSVQ